MAVVFSSAKTLAAAVTADKVKSRGFTVRRLENELGVEATSVTFNVEYQSSAGAFVERVPIKVALGDLSTALQKAVTDLEAHGESIA
jgi:hypothetical protein